MASINIGGQQDDIFYRYKMPPLKTRVDQKGGGTKTVLVNIEAIGKKLHRPPIYITKFFGYELSRPVQADVKKNCYAIRGPHQCELLQSLLGEFVEKFVICVECGNPETEFVLNKQEPVELHKVCDACGRQRPDNMKSHKLSAFIIKDLQNNPNVGQNTEIVDDQPIVTSNVADDLSLCNQLAELIESARSENKLQDIDTVNEIIIDADHFNLLRKVPLIAAKCLFTANILEEIDTYKLFFQELCKKNRKGQEYLLHSLEALINDHDDIRARILNKKMMGEIFYKFYEGDIVGEETFRRWQAKTSSRFANPTISKQLREMSEEFIQWLNQPDASDDDQSPEAQ